MAPEITRRPDQEPLLHRPIDQVVYVVLAVAELSEGPRGAPKSCISCILRQRVLVGLLYRLAGEEPRRVAMPLEVTLADSLL